MNTVHKIVSCLRPRRRALSPLAPSRRPTRHRARRPRPHSDGAALRRLLRQPRAAIAPRPRRRPRRTEVRAPPGWSRAPASHGRACDRRTRPRASRRTGPVLPAGASGSHRHRRCETPARNAGTMRSVTTRLSARRVPRAPAPPPRACRPFRLDSPAAARSGTATMSAPQKTPRAVARAPRSRLVSAPHRRRRRPRPLHRDPGVTVQRPPHREHPAQPISACSTAAGATFSPPLMIRSLLRPVIQM